MISQAARRRTKKLISQGARRRPKFFSQGGETTELLISGDLHRDANQGVWSELSEEVESNLSESVVSLVLSDGHTVLLACSGITVQHVGYVTSFLTSASLVKAFNDKRNVRDNLKIEVRHEDNAATGFLGEYDLDHNIAVVNVMNFPDLHDVLLYDPVQFPPHSKVVVVGRDISGKLIATSGLLNCYSSESEYGGKLRSSTCTISKVCEGGPLFYFDGKFVGMNLSLSAGRTFFLPKFIVVMWLVNHCTSLQEIELPPQSNSSKAVRVGERLIAYKDVPNKDQFGDLESLGYPKPPESMLNVLKRLSVTNLVKVSGVN